MSDYTVTPSALTDAASGMDAVASANRATAGSMSPPPALMMGLFMSPLVATLGDGLHSGARSLVDSVGQMNTSLAENLRGTAANYAEAGAFASEQANGVGR